MAFFEKTGAKNLQIFNKREIERERGDGKEALFGQLWDDSDKGSVLIAQTLVVVLQVLQLLQKSQGKMLVISFLCVKLIVKTLFDLSLLLNDRVV